LQGLAYALEIAAKAGLCCIALDQGGPAHVEQSALQALLDLQADLAIAHGCHTLEIRSQRMRSAL
jgi:hypothetical protein